MPRGAAMLQLPLRVNGSVYLMNESHFTYHHNEEFLLCLLSRIWNCRRDCFYIVGVCVCVCACVRACVCARVRARVRVCTCVHVCACACVCLYYFFGRKNVGTIASC